MLNLRCKSYLYPNSSDPSDRIWTEPVHSAQIVTPGSITVVDYPINGRGDFESRPSIAHLTGLSLIFFPQASRRRHITSHDGNLRRAPNGATGTHLTRLRLLMEYRGLQVRYCGDYRWLTQGRSCLRWRATPPRSFNSGEKFRDHRLFPLPDAASDKSPRS
jgi:hypothetical protein